jgi:ADP-heptose:LPS heptosyltransferase
MWRWQYFGYPLPNPFYKKGGGTLHLAGALKVPTLSLFSATDSQRIGPYQDPGLHRVIQKEGGFVQRLPKEKRTDEAMRLISVDEVFEAYANIVSHRSV